MEVICVVCSSVLRDVNKNKPSVLLLKHGTQDLVRVLTKNMMQQMAPTEKWAGYFFKQQYDESPILRGKSIS